MSRELFTTTIRNAAIETTCSNLVIVGVLLKQEVATYTIKLTSMNDYELAEQLCYSRLLLDNYYESMASKGRN